MRIVHRVIFRRGEMESSSVGDAHSFNVDVVIIGAGLSGLTAAHQLWKKDPSLHVAVLEAKGGLPKKWYLYSGVLHFRT